MKLSGLLLLFGLAVSASAQDKAQPKPTYESMVERTKAGDKTVDFRSLRLAYADSPNYSNRPDVSKQKRSMSAALKNRDFDKAIENADAVLASNFVDIDAHFVEYIAHRELKHEEASEFHKAIAQGLLKSITDSGDGKAPDTAYQVIEVHEEYVLLHFMGVGLPKSQSLLKKNGHSYDQITFDDPQSKQEVKLFFNVDIPMKHGL